MFGDYSFNSVLECVMATILNRESLPLLKDKAGINVPTYNLDEVKPGILHFGPGRFASGHIQVLAHRLLEKGLMDSGVIAVSPKLSTEFDAAAQNQRARTRKTAFEVQDNLYAVLSDNGIDKEIDVIGSLKDIWIGPDNVQRVVNQMANPQTKLVTMTITQNGYYYDPVKGIRFNHSDIIESTADNPRATVAYLVMGLEARKNAGLDSFGVMSLDNMEGNGEKLRQTVLAYAGKYSKDLRDWIAKNTPFYSTMVDRIVPNPEEGVQVEIQNMLGLEDSLSIVTEPERHLRLIVERSRHGPESMREPEIPLNLAGAQYVDDVEPFELAKLRMLNGGHMALGVVGRLCGQTHADDALKNNELKEFLWNFLGEVSATLHPAEGMDFNEYREEVIARMSNPALHDELSRLARNGVEKIASRFISPLRDAYAKDLPRQHLVTALAGWVKYLASANPDQTIKKDTDDGLCINDSEAYKRGLVDLAKSLNGDVTPILSVQGLFGGLENEARFITEFSAAYRRLSGYDGQQKEFGLGSPPPQPV
jgi:mannitol-1-phosphate/altronate dehydrogenase